MVFLKNMQVCLENIEVRNIPDGDRGKLLVVFSKTQSDSLFHAEQMSFYRF